MSPEFRYGLTQFIWRRTGGQIRELAINLCGKPARFSGIIVGDG